MLGFGNRPAHSLRVRDAWTHESPLIHVITDPESRARALRCIQRLWNAVPGTAEAAEFDALATLVDAYERRRFPMAPPDPRDAIEPNSTERG